MPTTTATRLYAETFLPPGGIAKFVSDRRPTSWRRIALELRDLTNGRVDVTPETIRRWYADSTPADAA